MSLRYIIVPSPFREGEFFVRTIPGTTYTLEEAIGSATQETALTETELRGSLIVLSRLRNEALLRGQTVDFGEFGTYSMRLRATLEDSDAPLPPDAVIDVRVDLPRQTVKSLRDQVSTERSQRAPSQPVINTFYDGATKQKDTVYTTGIAARLTGKFLSFDEEDETQGVFFVAEGGTAVRATVYLTKGNKRVDFNIPGGLTGAQSVELRARRKDEGALLAADPVGPLQPA